MAQPNNPIQKPNMHFRHPCIWSPLHCPCPALAADMRHVSGPSVVSLRDLNLAYNNMGDRGLARLVQGVTTLLHPQADGWVLGL